MHNTRLYIGIETKVREFEAKLLLACIAAEAGYDVVLGQQRVFLKRLGTMPMGILVNKSISPSNARYYAHYHKLGYKLVAYDEEGLAPFNAEEYQKRRIAVGALQPLEYFFTWGQWQTDVILEKAPLEKDKLVLVGHPRVDLTRRELRGFYQDEVNALQMRYGRFILINTNFSFYNHFLSRDIEAIIHEKTKAGKVADEAHRQFYMRVHNHKKNLFYAFVEMTTQLQQRFPDVAIVLRPHPSENHDYWREVLPAHEKIHVVYEGNVLPWILASEIMIHNSCTTGIEGYLLEKPIIAYRPVQDSEVDHELPNQLSDQTFTLDALLERVGQYLTHGRNVSTAEDAQKRELAAHYIASLDGPLSCERIVASLNQIRFSEKTMKTYVYQIYTNMRKMKNRLASRIIKAMRGGQSPRDLARAEYIEQKFPGIELTEIQTSMKKFQQLTSRFSDLQVRQLESNMFNIAYRK